MKAARNALLRWYDKHKRDLPWRRTRDPYAIWVSEIMCQQTRVETVIPYFHRFLERFPTATDLAAADEDAVMSMWSGLGYYRRARLLHKGVREVVSRYGGKVPPGAEDRLSLPGVGRYTAGAIGSIAFGEEEAVVDGNVSRVLSRVHRIDAPLGSAASTRALWSRAEELVKGPRPGDLNQSLMELGGAICTPTSPRCPECPIQSHCGAGKQGDATAFPVPKKKKAPKRQRMIVVIATVRDELWLSRGERALFGGLWGLPTIEAPLLSKNETAEDPSDAQQDEEQKLAARALRHIGISARTPKHLGAFKHVLTHRIFETSVWRAKGARAEAHESLRLLPMHTLDELGIATYTRKALALL